MPKASRYWTCEVCGQVLANEPRPVLSHVMSHAERRPFASGVVRVGDGRAADGRAADGRAGDPVRTD